MEKVKDKPHASVDSNIIIITQDFCIKNFTASFIMSFHPSSQQERSFTVSHSTSNQAEALTLSFIYGFHLTFFALNTTVWAPSIRKSTSSNIKHAIKSMAWHSKMTILSCARVHSPWTIPGVGCEDLVLLMM